MSFQTYLPRPALGLAGFLAIAAVIGFGTGDNALAQSAGARDVARYTEDGRMLLPEGFREWVFIGAPLTPHALNGEAAGFPEFHHVYIEPGAWAEYQRTGTFPEGTVIAKELVLLEERDYPDGSRDEPSGRGFFADPQGFAGLDVIVKDSEAYAETNGWGFFNFNHSAPPYKEASAVEPEEACAFCHAANAEKDMVFTQFYPILN